MNCRASGLESAFWKLTWGGSRKRCCRREPARKPGQRNRTWFNWFGRDLKPRSVPCRTGEGNGENLSTLLPPLARNLQLGGAFRNERSNAFAARVLPDVPARR